MPQRDEPLTPLTMAILLALSKEDQHGYALMREVAAQTDGTIMPGTGSLYAALERLTDEGLIAESRARPAGDEDRRRRYYRITEAGRETARAEAARMLRVLDTARAKRLIPSLASLRSGR